MKITFLVQTSEPKVHLIQHNTSFGDRFLYEKGKTAISPIRFSHENEWERYKNAHPNVIAKINWNDNPYDSPQLIGVIEGLVKFLPDPGKDQLVYKQRKKK